MNNFLIGWFKAFFCTPEHVESSAIAELMARHLREPYSATNVEDSGIITSFTYVGERNRAEVQLDRRDQLLTIKFLENPTMRPLSVYIPLSMSAERILRLMDGKLSQHLGSRLQL